MTANIGKVLKFVAVMFPVSLGIVVLIATTLIFTDSPQVPVGNKGGITFTSAVEVDYTDLPTQRDFVARDGARLSYRLYGNLDTARRLLVLVHGSAWHGMQFHQLAKEVANDAETAVVVPDLRGHGPNPIRRGDVDYVGQYEADLIDLIDAVAPPRQDLSVVLGGHSSGGGLVVRFAGGAYRDAVDGFILIAPYLKYDAPTTRANSGNWAFPATRRIIGLSMLNTLGITALNGLSVIAFAMPQAVLDGPLGPTVTTSYSYRLNTSFAPRSDFEADLRAIERPMLLLAGEEDEAFNARLYEPVISAQTPTGTYEILSGSGHIDVLTDMRSGSAIKSWLIANGE